MSEKQSSRNVADVAPGNDIWAEEGLPASAGRSWSGGGYSDAARKHLESDGLERTIERPDPLAPPPSGGAGEDFWGRSNHTAG